MITYSRFNNFRKKEFRLITMVKKSDDGQKVALKKAATGEAAGFLESLIRKRALLLENDFSIEPVEVKLKGEVAFFEYSDGISLDSLLLRSVVSQDKEEFYLLLREFSKQITNSEKIFPKFSQNFVEIFGEPKKQEDARFLKVGVVDLLFENIMVDVSNREFQLIDYEWVFEFPVPSKFVIFRSLVSFYRKNKVYNLNDFIPLVELYSLFGIGEREKEEFIFFEFNFQNYATMKECSLEKFKEGILALEKSDVSFSQKRTISSLVELDGKIMSAEGAVRIMKESKFWKLRNHYLRSIDIFKQG